MEIDKRSTVNGAASGPTLPGSFATWDPESSSWRMSQLSLFEDSTASQETWPRSGMTVNGTAFPLPTLAHPINATGSGSWPTPTTRDYKDSPGMALVSKDGRDRLDQLPRVVFHREGTQKGGGHVNPDWIEWLMGYPPGWTDLKPSEMPSSLQLPQASSWP